MPFSTDPDKDRKLKSNYIYMINELLDNIPVVKVIDFDNAIIDLEKILKADNTTEIEFHPDFKGGTVSVFEALMDPTMYGVLPNLHLEYQELIKNCIEAKIKRFREFTPEQKIQYMENQQRLRNEAAALKERITAAEPRREADELLQQTERQAFLAQQQRILDSFQRRTSVSIPQADSLSDRVRNLISELVARMSTQAWTPPFQPREETPVIARDTGIALSLQDQNRENTLTTPFRDYYSIMQNSTILQGSMITQDRLQPATTQNNRSGLGYAFTLGLFTGNALLMEIGRRINMLIQHGHLTLDEARNLNPMEMNVLISPPIFGYIIGNELSVADVRALTPRQRSRLLDGDSLEEVMNRGPSIAPRG